MTSTEYEVEDDEAAIEFFHRRGWTDGLPIIPPTPERVARMLDRAGLSADEVLGRYPERRITLTAEKAAIAAVMAGCLPEHFPVVVAIAEAMLSRDLPVHNVNSSTGSFALAFIVNGPIREALGMNWRGNVLGPGNRANSSIGRAIRLLQINALGSVPGAGLEEQEHGRPVLDRSMMGQPAKYAGWHIVENEEDFPSLTPTHVELGFAPTDSTVTVMPAFGCKWLDTNSDGSPEEWIGSFAQAVVGAGVLVDSGPAIVIIPPESVRLFVNAGWTKDDIRRELFEHTRRSVAWVKENGYWVGHNQRTRLMPVEPGDEERFVAISGTPEDLRIVVCGGPAGAWPYYLHTYDGSGATVTQKIRW